jgi:hypothetical protein
MSRRPEVLDAAAAVTVHGQPAAEAAHRSR